MKTSNVAIAIWFVATAAFAQETAEPSAGTNVSLRILVKEAFVTSAPPVNKLIRWDDTNAIVLVKAKPLSRYMRTGGKRHVPENEQREMSIPKPENWATAVDLARNGHGGRADFVPLENIMEKYSNLGWDFVAAEVLAPCYARVRRFDCVYALFHRGGPFARYCHPGSIDTALAGLEAIFVLEPDRFAEISKKFHQLSGIEQRAIAEMIERSEEKPQREN